MSRPSSWVTRDTPDAQSRSLEAWEHRHIGCRLQHRPLMTKNETQSSRGNTEPKPAAGKRVPSIRNSSGARATPTKLTQAAQLLSRAGGATMAELGTASGWQPTALKT